MAKLKAKQRKTETDMDRELEQLSGSLFSGDENGKIREQYEALLSSRISRIGKLSSTNSILRRKKRWEYAEE
ncbi:hypothetical protein [Ruegeria arenilitoris]|uniref:hypothetical protein n=1 Tax=Ruegeria arenilitoris TaxID=1173585 RepID=UPI001479E93B|nr:hypothetical protein [Ruegeria arenilitoris]